MERKIKTALALLGGIALGAGLTQGLRAQGEKKPAYVIAEVDVTDAPGFQNYTAKVPPTLAPYNDHYIVRGKADGKEGDPPHGNIVVIEFPTMADATKWYSTPPYQDLIAERQKVAKSRVYIVEGLPQ